jgi:hypothetical protein
MEERWVACREFPDHYEVSDCGQVRRIKAGMGARRGRPRKQVRHKIGYMQCMLSVGNRCYMRSVHRLVADAFLGPIPPGLVVNHKNGVKHDNRLANLEIVTLGENRAHSYRVLGVKPNRGKIGPAHDRAKFGTDVVLAIRSAFNSGKANGPALAEKYGVSRQTIYRIARGETRREG